MHTSSPNQRAADTEESCRAIHGESSLLTTEPKREKERLMARAIAISFPTNHCEMIADCATEMASPPSPNTILPNNMS